MRLPFAQILAGMALGALLVFFFLLHMFGVVTDFEFGPRPFNERLAVSLPPMIYGLLLLVPTRKLTTRKKFLLHFIPLSTFTALTILLGLGLVALSFNKGKDPIALLFGLMMVVVAVSNLWASYEIYLRVKE